ncbi:hypothetical protein GCM10009096_20090 [Parasphingorhabdus litoris]|uniref:Uncharacterized protein n=1 Tax=Parasphingorhabdus litoris TaxID=394733 RepID=A0ABN1AJL5_9SPHN
MVCFVGLLEIGPSAVILYIFVKYTLLYLSLLSKTEIFVKKQQGAIEIYRRAALFYRSMVVQHDNLII